MTSVTPRLTAQCNSTSTDLSNSYSPRVDDYVRWVDSLGRVTEGWVYFYSEHYITIEVSVKDKPDELVNMHKKIHCLVVCHHWYWNELEYVKNRRGACAYPEGVEDTYKSQEYRYADVQ